MNQMTGPVFEEHAPTVMGNTTCPDQKPATVIHVKTRTATTSCRLAIPTPSTAKNSARIATPIFCAPIAGKNSPASSPKLPTDSPIALTA